ncbi:MAG: RND transporter, partial [Desulfomicrobium sp.]|nr:RND transporter [Desulfomicrobium sp.]
RFGVQARITTWHGDKVLQVPTGALFRRGMQWMVFVREEDVARLREIEIGHDNGLAAEVRAGLGEGDVVILHPPDSLREGMRVTEAN